MKTILTICAALLLSLTISAQNTITTDSILQTSTCAGGNVLVPFTATGNYPFGNNFIAQLSDNFGQFTNPVNIGQFPFNIGFIFATIPQNSNFGFLYKIRVISTNPAVTGTPCPNYLFITQIALLNQIIVLPNDTICQGDSAILTALNPASSYQWSNGDTSQSIIVSQAGVYSVTTTDILTCESSTSATIVVISCTTPIEENILSNSFVVYPNPASDMIYIDNIPFNKKKQYQIFNSIGQIAEEGFVCCDQIGTTDLTDGLYFIRVTTDKEYYSGKFIKE